MVEEFPWGSLCFENAQTFRDGCENLTGARWNRNMTQVFGTPPRLAWIPTERNSPDMMLGETVHFESLCPAPIRRNGALIAGLRCVSSHIDLAILANSEVSEAK
jgi:hypothetical protein